MSGIHFDIKFYQNLAREALANEIKARTGDGSVKGENVITWINENIQTAAANGSDIVNAWEHAYVSAYIYLQDGDQSVKAYYSAWWLGLAKEVVTFLQWSKDTLKDLYNNLKGLELAAQSVNLNDFQSKLFNAILTVENGQLYEQIKPELVLYASYDERIYSQLMHSEIKTLILYNISSLNEIKKFFTQAEQTEPKRVDPLLVDLDGDGIETTTLNDGVFFDHQSDGSLFKTWLKFCF